MVEGAVGCLMYGARKFFDSKNVNKFRTTAVIPLLFSL